MRHMQELVNVDILNDLIVQASEEIMTSSCRLCVTRVVETADRTGVQHV